ncbi:thioredoxin family protein [Sesbania bispinosa]|nr:thioredoxin family protein [Sesbania bispinosa]
MFFFSSWCEPPVRRNLQFIVLLGSLTTSPRPISILTTSLLLQAATMRHDEVRVHSTRLGHQRDEVGVLPRASLTIIKAAPRTVVFFNEDAGEKR